MDEVSYRSKKSNSTFTASGTKERAFLVVNGEAATNTKVMKEVSRIRRGGADMETVKWVAMQFANTF